MELIFEKSMPGRGLCIVPDIDVPPVTLEDRHIREQQLHLPNMSETGISRHYTKIAERTFGVNNGFYPLGSCTMKYNPKLNDAMANLSGFADIHPLQPEHTVKGCLEVMATLETYLCEVTGMDELSFQPAAGAQGELAGLLLMKAYHMDRGDSKRDKIIIPDSAHGTNPASAAVAGFKVVNIPSTKEGFVDIEALKKAVGDDTAGLMITNPNTVGLFDENILEVTKIIHDAGGLNYYDGANLNAIMGITRPGDMGFDVIHLNLHKTFSTPHGGGGPGCGPVGCKDILAPYLPGPKAIKEGEEFKFFTPSKSIGRVKSYYGHFLVFLRAFTYVLTLGGNGLKEASENAVLNANYMMERLKDTYEVAFDGPCMHEFVISVANLKKEHKVSALDIAKALLDNGIHPPTMYFPLIVPEALMLEPTETEDRETLDRVVEILKEIYQYALENPEDMHNFPKTTPIGRPDEVTAARNPILRYEW